jgi:hypothetical protein
MKRASQFENLPPARITQNFFGQIHHAPAMVQHRERSAAGRLRKAP